MGEVRKEGCELPGENASSAEIDEIVYAARVVAVIGLSPKPERPSHRVAAYLIENGFEVIPVNPGSTEIVGRKCYASLAEVPGDIDVVDIFRQLEAVPEIVDAAIAKKAKVVWMQEGIVHNEAAARARAAGLKVVMNRCMLKEHTRAKGARRT
jgi:predicted CoA-binding protein